MRSFFSTLLFSLFLITGASAQVIVETIPLDATLTAWGGMTLGPDGNLYIADSGYDEPFVFSNTRDSAVVRVNLSLDQGGQMTGTVEPLIKGIDGPWDVTFDADGNLVVGSTNWIETYDTDGNRLKRAIIGQAVGVNQGPDGRIYIAHCGAFPQASIRVLTSANFVSGFISQADGVPFCPTDVVFDDDGNVYVSFDSPVVHKFEPDGTNMTVLVDQAKGLPAFQTPVFSRMVYANGVIYLTRRNQVYQITTGGELTVLAGRLESGNNDGTAWSARFHELAGIAASVTGDTLFVLQAENPNAPEGQRLARTRLRMITGVQSAQTSPVATEEAELPDGFALDQNYPNPFNPGTSIRFSLPEAMPVRLAVYDVFGREVATLFDGYKASGTHEVRFEADHLPSGTYLYRLAAGVHTQTRRMTLLK